ncbi:MAG: type VI secretion system tube protein Hcp [Candidatus Eisenbacteria bacterium]
MAETVHLYPAANGVDIQGESTQMSIGREQHRVRLLQAVCPDRARIGFGNATGRRAYDLLVIRKRIDKSTPLLYKALVENQVIEVEFALPSESGR